MFHQTHARGEVYELRTYHVAENKMEPLLTRFRDHSLALLSTHGMTHMGYWLPVDESERSRRLVYIVAHQSVAAGRASWGAFSKDPAWQRARDESERTGKLVTAFDSVYLEPVSVDNVLLNTLRESAARSRLYELRVFQSEKGRQAEWVGALQLKGMPLWQKHGMQVVALWRSVPTPKNSSESVAVLFVHVDAESAEAKGRALAADPAWTELLNSLPKPAVEPASGADRPQLLSPVDFSPLK